MVYLSHPKDRLMWIIDNYSQGKPSRFAKRVGVSPSVLTNVLHCGRDPSFKIIASVLRIHREINPDWLLHDFGEKLRDLKGDKKKNLDKETIMKYLIELIEVLDEK